MIKPTKNLLLSEVGLSRRRIVAAGQKLEEGLPGEIASAVEFSAASASRTTRLGKTALPSGITSHERTPISQMRRSPLLQRTNKAAPVIEVEEPEVLEIPYLADHVIIRYRWTDENGQDLDTRTSIVGQEGEVGWSRLNSTDYLTWGGDNTDAIGQEAVNIDLAAVKEDFPNATVEIELRAFWYGSVEDGIVTVDYEFWLGGVMSKVGTDFQVTGGELISRDTSNFEVLTQESYDIDGELLTKLTLDPDITS